MEPGGLGGEHSAAELARTQRGGGVPVEKRAGGRVAAGPVEVNDQQAAAGSGKGVGGAHEAS